MRMYGYDVAACPHPCAVMSRVWYHHTLDYQLFCHWDGCVPMSAHLQGARWGWCVVSFLCGYVISALAHHGSRIVMPQSPKHTRTLYNTVCARQLFFPAWLLVCYILPQQWQRRQSTVSCLAVLDGDPRHREERWQDCTLLVRWTP